MCTSVDLSLLLFFNIDTGDERRRPCNAFESTLSPNPCKLAFAFACLSTTSYFSIREVFAFMGSQDAEDRLAFLYVLTDIEKA